MPGLRDSAPVQVARDLHRRLRGLALLRGTNMRDLAETAVAQYLQRQAPQLTDQERSFLDHCCHPAGLQNGAGHD